MIKLKVLFPIAFLAVFTACTNHTTNKESKQKTVHASDSAITTLSDTIHLRTGLYYLTEGNDGVLIKKDAPNEIYSLSKEPFASVDNISNTRLVTQTPDSGPYTELCMTFDAKGKEDLEEGTGNGLHPRIAFVLDGKLLYVVDNISKIRTGIMCVELVGYSDEAMAAMKKAVDQKH